MTTDEILFDAEERMDKAANVFKDELRGLRTGRATPALVDSLRVMDAAAIDMCRTAKLPILVFNFNLEGNIERAIAGQMIGTLVETN